MKRRNFISTSVLSGLGFTFGGWGQKDLDIADSHEIRGAFSLDSNRVTIHTKAMVEETRIFHITDTHLSMDDERGEPFREFSGRMAGAYAENSHFLTGEKSTTKESFSNTLSLIKDEGADLIALTGDIFSFPSEAAVEWAYSMLMETGIPFVYIAGNHDWHYEGMKGSSQFLREVWTERRLKTLYQGNHPLYASYDMNGIRIVCIDNSTYEILPVQLDFFRKQTDSGLPLILLMHIPLYIPGRSLGFGCGHPMWGSGSDRGFETERREKWREGGHTETTMKFREEVFMCDNILCIFAGHTHRYSLDVEGGVPQVVTRHNATGAYSDIRILSAGNG
jgi:predicted MPP superfamily phosphohydrolase